MFSYFSQVVQRYFSPTDQVADVSFFFKQCAQLALGLFFVALFIPLKISVYQTAFFASGDSSPYQHFFLYLSDIFFLVSFLCIGLSLFFDSSKLALITFGNRFLLFFWLTLLTLAELSLIFSADRMLSFFLVLRLVQGFSLYLMILNQYIPLRILFSIFLFGMLGESLLGVFQYLHGGSLGLSFLGEAPLNTGMTGVSTLMVDGQETLRAYGTFPHPNIFAAYGVVGFFMLLGAYKQHPYRYRVIAVLLFAAFLVTFSRTAFFAAMIGYSVYYGITKRQLGLKAMATMGAVLLVLLTTLNIGGLFLERMKFQDTQALQFRAENFTDGMRLLIARPFGVGLGQSSMALQAVVPDKLSPWEYQPAHNLFLAVSNELGLLGLALYLSLFTYILVQLYRRRRYAPQVFALWVSVGILSLTDHYLFSLYHGWVLFVILVAITHATLEQRVYALEESPSEASILLP